MIVLAQLIRVFAFGGFDDDGIATECIFEAPRDAPDRYDVCYRALVRLTVRDETGEVSDRARDRRMASGPRRVRHAESVMDRSARVISDRPLYMFENDGVLPDA